MAVLRGQLDQLPVILASATPSLESWVNAGKTGAPPRYGYLALPKRVHNARLPTITAINLRKTPPESGRWLAPPLVEAIGTRLEVGYKPCFF